MSDTRPSSVLTDVKLAFPPADRLGAKVEYYHFLPHEKSYTVNVYFIRQAPDADTIDRVLRECLALAVAHDGRFTVSADAYLVPGDDIDVHERKNLLPWGKDRFLCFDAVSRQIGVRRYGKKHFEEKQAITGVDAIGTGDNVDYPDRQVNPAYDGEDMEEELEDGATDDMRHLVSEWIWYGFASAEMIDGWIDANAADGGGFDLAFIKAFAAARLAKKRAAEARWPEETDNDRIDRAFARLREQGVLAVQWAGDCMDDGFEAVGERLNEDGVADDQYQGFCFFHSQDMDNALEGEGLLLAYGPTDSDEDEDAVRIGRLVCDALQKEGLQTEWDGTAKRRIAVPRLRWQRRTPA